MTIETPSDLAEQIADWLGIYGGCKNKQGDDNNCAYDESKPFCCRQGLVGALEERIVNSVDNQRKIDAVFNAPHYPLSLKKEKQVLEQIAKIITVPAPVDAQTTR